MPLEKVGEDITKIEVTSVKLKDNKVILDLLLNDSRKEKVKVTYLAYEDFMFREGLVKVSDFNKMLISNLEYEVKLYITNLIVRKPYSKYEITIKTLEKFKDSDKKLINKVIEQLEKERIIDDFDYTNMYLDYFNSNYYGKYYIINFFKEKRISDSILFSLKFSFEQENEKAQKYFEIIKNKYVSNNLVKQKRKLYEVMLKRGFDNEIILELINSLNIDPRIEKENLRHDYFKAKYKFRKYPNCNDMVVSYLVNNGYQLVDVKEVMQEEEEGINND